MNPLVKHTIDKISEHFKLSNGEKIIVAYFIGEALVSALEYAKENPNWNLKGGESIDENTITTKRNKAYENMFKNLKFSFPADESEKIADNFAIGFAEWLIKYPDKGRNFHGEIVHAKGRVGETYLTKELLEIYKKEQGL